MDNTVIRSNVVKPYAVLRLKELVSVLYIGQPAQPAHLERLRPPKALCLVFSTQPPQDQLWFIPSMLLRAAGYLVIDRISRSMFNDIYYRIYEGRDASQAAKVTSHPLILCEHPHALEEGRFALQWAGALAWTKACMAVTSVAWCAGEGCANRVPGVLQQELHTRGGGADQGAQGQRDEDRACDR